MINYFPKRSSVKGFAESIGNKVKDRLKRDLKKVEPVPAQTIIIHRPRVGIGHWANRGYEEYKRAA